MTEQERIESPELWHCQECEFVGEYDVTVMHMMKVHKYPRLDAGMLNRVLSVDEQFHDVMQRIPELSWTQLPLGEQIQKLRAVANRLGLHDAADLLTSKE